MMGWTDGTKIGAALLAFTLLLGTASGCAGGQAEPAGQEQPAGGGPEERTPAAVNDGLQGSESAAEGEQAEEQETSGAPVTDARDGEPETGDPEEAGTGEIAKTHYMNQNYFLKPVDEDGDRRVVLLTFDDGPKEEALLTSILDTLDRHEAKAIFFVNGFRVRQNPDLLRLIDERGHVVGNHSYDHIVLKNEPADVVDRQLEDVQAIVEETIGKTPRFFRPPNGAGGDYAREKARELGMLYMNWSNGSMDWDDNRNDPDGVIRTVMDQLNPGNIILMHELSWTAEALDELLTRIREEGYRFLHPEAIEPEAG